MTDQPIENDAERARLETEDANNQHDRDAAERAQIRINELNRAEVEREQARCERADDVHEIDTSVDGCGAHEPGHPHTDEGLRLIREHGAVHISGTRYRIGPPLPEHWDYNPDAPPNLRHYACVNGDGAVVNVFETEPHQPYGKAHLAAVSPDFAAVIDVTDLDPEPSIGWTRNASGTLVPSPSLVRVPNDADSPTEWVVTYTDHRDSAPASVEFEGAGPPVSLVDGTASVVVTAQDEARTITVAGISVIVPAAAGS
jgi:hypothetical protein